MSCFCRGPDLPSMDEISTSCDSSAWFLQRLCPSPSPQFPPPCTWVFLECLQAHPSLSLPKQHPSWTSPTPLLPFQAELLKELTGCVPTAPLSLLALLLQPSPLASHCTFSCLWCQWLPVPPVCLDSHIHTSLQRISLNSHLRWETSCILLYLQTCTWIYPHYLLLYCV